MEFDFFGTELYISPAALAMAALFYYMTNPISVFFVLISISVHEAGHLLAVKICKEKIRAVSIEAWGLSIRYAGEVSGEGEKLICTLAGPGAGMVLYFFCDFFPRSAFLSGLADMTFTFTLINLFPCRPLDGGNALYCILRTCFPYKRADCIMRSILNTALSLFLLTGLVFACSNKGTSLLLIAVYLGYFNMSDEYL